MFTSSRCLSSIGYNLKWDVEDAIPYEKQYIMQGTASSAVPLFLYKKGG